MGALTILFTKNKTYGRILIDFYRSVKHLISNILLLDLWLIRNKAMKYYLILAKIHQTLRVQNQKPNTLWKFC